MTTTTETLSPRDYQQAIEVQDACNLSGVVHAFSRVMTKIWKDANANGHGTDYVNRHPIVVMYVSKLDSLCAASDLDTFDGAYHKCRDAYGCQEGGER